MDDRSTSSDGASTLVKSAQIMLIDDEPEILSVLAEILGRQGYETSTFTRGEAGLRAAEERPPDLVLLDVRMPDMDGYEVCRRFKSRPLLRGVPILFLSALHETTVKVKGFEAGAVDFITKPPHIAEVLARVGTHLALGRAYAELERKNRALKALEERRDELVHMTLHDMRSPLQTILGQIEMVAMLHEERSLGECPDIEEARAGVMLLHRMMNDILDVSRMKDNKLPVVATSVGLQHLVSEVLHDYIPAKHLPRMQVEIPDDCPAVYCDPAITLRILANLLDNAIKYSSALSPVRVSVEDTGDSIEVGISDKGQGIDSGQHALIFQKFYSVKGEEGDDRHCRSFGFGLAFCKLAAEAQGGNIRLHSVPGEGSTFSLVLPKAGL